MLSTNSNMTIVVLTLIFIQVILISRRQEISVKTTCHIQFYHGGSSLLTLQTNLLNMMVRCLLKMKRLKMTRRKSRISKLRRRKSWTSSLKEIKSMFLIRISIRFLSIFMKSISKFCSQEILSFWMPQKTSAMFKLTKWWKLTLKTQD